MDLSELRRQSSEFREAQAARTYREEYQKGDKYTERAPGRGEFLEYTQSWEWFLFLPGRIENLVFHKVSVGSPKKGLPEYSGGVSPSPSFPSPSFPGPTLQSLKVRPKRLKLFPSNFIVSQKKIFTGIQKCPAFN